MTAARQAEPGPLVTVMMLLQTQPDCVQTDECLGQPVIVNTHRVVLKFVFSLAGHHSIYCFPEARRRREN